METIETTEKPRSKFVLRLLVVKVEGVLLPSPREWGPPFSEKIDSIPDGFEDSVFSEWAGQLNREQTELRQLLKQQAREGEFEINGSLREVIDYAQNHSPLRVALLSSGPREWIKGINQRFQLNQISDLLYCSDHYPPGERRVLLQFLMNRFIAGRERTLLLGNSLADERLADREQTRFRSLCSAPEQAIEPFRWDWSPTQLMDFIKEKQPRG